ncbi:D-alanyl-D-alanine carboxypeptidase [Bacillus cereus Rock3-42]|nr:D-alanyl-D-alanine carboxypeptidase [Bacillus cereus Rock3-42]
MDGIKVGKTDVYVGNEKVGERNLFYSKRKLVATTGMYWNNVKEIFSYMIGVGSDG